VDRNIPKTKVIPKTFYAFSRKATKLHSALRRINALIRKLQLAEDAMNSQYINQEVEEISRLSQIEIGTRITSSSTAEEIKDKIKELMAHQKAIYRARKLENNMAHKQRIEKNIQKRFSNFSSNTKKMIDSILGRYKAPVTLNNIIHENYNTMEPKEVKQEIKEHFRK